MKPGVRWVMGADGFPEREHVEQTARGFKVRRYTSRGIVLEWELVMLQSPE